jgi:hypothetical protein
MKKIITTSLIIVCGSIAFAQNNVGIGTTTPNTSAALDISSTTKGLLIPRMTTTQRNAIITPANGLMVFDTNTNGYWYFSNNNWNSFSGSGPLSLPYLGNANTNNAAFKIINQGYGAAVEGASGSNYGIGTAASSSGIGGWGLYAYVNRNSAIAVNAFSDSGMVFQGTNMYPGNTSTVMALANNGLGNTATLQVQNPANASSALQVATNGIGEGMRVYLTNTANSNSAINIQNSGIGAGLSIKMNNASNGARGIDIVQSGAGPGVFVTSASGNAVWGIAGSISAAGVIGDNTLGEAVVGRSRGGSGVGAVVGRCDSSGYGVRGFNTKTGIGVLGQAGMNGGTGVGGRFENVNAASSNNALEAVTSGTGAAIFIQNMNAGPVSSLAVFKKGNTNVARIDGTGKAFFNGGTQSSGADVAEVFNVSGDGNTYEPGDVLIISTTTDRTVERSATAYSNLVSGVYATRPGVLLTEENIDAGLDGQVPMGVIGVIPTKVNTEGGAIKRGDMLVTSSASGVAMKGDPAIIKTGQVIGKALQDYNNTNATGKIKVLVSIK